jgi:ribosomal protein S27E
MLTHRSRYVRVTQEWSDEISSAGGGPMNGTRSRQTILVYYSQNVRCEACGTDMRVIGDGQDTVLSRTNFVVTCPSCQRDIACEASRPIVPRNVQVVWFQEH